MMVEGKGWDSMYWRKILFATCALTLFATTAFAALDVKTIGEERQKSSESIPYDWPIGAHCSATDVNMRSAPNTDSEVVGTLQNGDQVYVSEFSDNRYEGYPWVAVTTAQGQKGYVNAKYLDADTDAMTREERFKAAFNSTVFWKYEQMANAFDGVTGNGYMRGDTGENGHFDPNNVKIALGNDAGYSYGRDTNGTFRQSTVRILKSDYQVAGISVGDSVKQGDLELFNADMQAMGWRHGKINSDAQKWYLDGRIDGKTAPIKGFFVVLDKDNKIQEINWQQYSID